MVSPSEMARVEIGHLKEHPAGLVKLDDDELGGVDAAGSSIPCITLVIATVTQCFSNTAIWGSCELGTRGCCR